MLIYGYIIFLYLPRFLFSSLQSTSLALLLLHGFHMRRKLGEFALGHSNQVNIWNHVGSIQFINNCSFSPRTNVFLFVSFVFTLYFLNDESWIWKHPCHLLQRSFQFSLQHELRTLLLHLLSNNVSMMFCDDRTCVLCTTVQNSYIHIQVLWPLRVIHCILHLFISFTHFYKINAIHCISLLYYLSCEETQ